MRIKRNQLSAVMLCRGINNRIGCRKLVFAVAFCGY
jgi:hypothetical protein